MMSAVRGHAFRLIAGLLGWLWSGAAMAATADSDVLLFLGVNTGGHQDEKLDRILVDYLNKSGETLAGRSRLSAADRRCTAQECLGPLAARAQATLVLAASVERADEQSRLLRVWIFDAGTRQAQEEKAVSEPEQIEQSLKELIAKVLHVHRLPPDVRETAPRPAAAASAGLAGAAEEGSTAKEDAGIVMVRRSSRLPTWRKGLAGALGGAAALTLVASIALTWPQHSPAPGTCLHDHDTNCLWDFTPAFSAGYAVTGALLIGMGLTLGLR